jgi:hypothetical protein
MKTYDAREAAAQSDVLVDKDGTIWVAVNGGARWDYLTEYTESADGPSFYGLTGWDRKKKLPTDGGPYHMLDDAAIQFILNTVRTRL